MTGPGGVCWGGGVLSGSMEMLVGVPFMVMLDQPSRGCRGTGVGHAGSGHSSWRMQRDERCQPS